MFSSEGAQSRLQFVSVAIGILLFCGYILEPSVVLSVDYSNRLKSPEQEGSNPSRWIILHVSGV